MNEPDGKVASFNAGTLELQSGGALEDTRLVYQTFGEPASDGSNAIVLPTYYGGDHTDNARMVGVHRALNPRKWFIIIPNLIGNGVSTSPGNTVAAQRGNCFPSVSILDNVRLQRRLLRSRFGIEKVRLVLGWSMGGLQAYQWAAAWPEAVESMLCICGAARAAPHNRVFLAGLRAALEADRAFTDPQSREHPVAGLRAFARVYAGWAYSQTFFRDGTFRALGCDSIDALFELWERDHLRRDPHDLTAMLDTWSHADLGLTPGAGSFEAALGRITARAIVMPCNSDLYFTVADNAYEVAHMRDAQLRVIDSDWGHVAGGPDRVANATAAIENAIRELLNGPAV